MPSGPYQADAPHVVLPDREKMKDADGSVDLSFQDCHRRLPCSRRRGFTNASNRRAGEIGYYAVSDCTAKPYRPAHAHAEFRESDGSAGDVEGYG